MLSRFSLWLLASSIFLSTGTRAAQPISLLDPLREAARNPIVNDVPAVNVLEGAILGNGQLGAVVETLPDAVMIPFGHNAVWDQRMEPVPVDKMGTFLETLKKIEALPTTLDDLNQDPWYKAYTMLGKGSYQKPYPRPYPCGMVVLGFDRRDAEMLGYKVEVDKGLCRVDFLINGAHEYLELFTDMGADRLWARMVDAAGQPIKAPFKYLAILPDKINTPKEFPRLTYATKSTSLAYRQVLPFDEISKAAPYRANPKDKAVSLSAAISTTVDPKGDAPDGTPIEGAITGDAPFYLCAQLDQGLASAVPLAEAPTADAKGYAEAASRSVAAWQEYWSKSGVVLDDPLLEQVWYWNTYFLRCAVKPGGVAPGMYGNTPWPNKPVLWHGDYHMDYNTEQVFWGTFSSNHPELNLPYVGLVENMLPVAEKFAKDYYQMRGAYFPISTYPVEMRSYPYAAPVFNWMIGVNAWWVQSLWWQYLYTMDKEYLRTRGFGPIRDVTLFLVDYIKRPDVAARPWKDNYAHIFPTFPPELYQLKPGLPREYNADTIVDLTLSKFVFKAYLQACEALGLEKEEAQNIADVKDILARQPPYPMTQSPRGPTFLSVPAEKPGMVFNVPLTTMPVFPGEDIGLGSAPETFALAASTYRMQQNEGGNEIVFLSLQGARLGLLDLEKFKREIRYNIQPNGTVADKNLQVGGRFGFVTREYDWMKYIAVFTENFALPAVINECLLQGYDGELRFFPNWPSNKDAEFRTLRAAGAFLVSAQLKAGRVQWAEISSEAGGTLKVVSPWKDGAACTQNGKRTTFKDAKFSVETKKGDVITLRPLAKN